MHPSPRTTIRAVLVPLLSVAALSTASACGQQPGAGDRKQDRPAAAGAAAQDPQKTGPQEDRVPPPPSAFIRRVVPGERPDGTVVAGPERLETAIHTYRRATDGVVVDLVAEMHIADPAHYEQIQERLATYDAVLYELVADEDDRPVPGQARGGNNPLTWIQGNMSRSMGLAFQLDSLDYRQDNFVHADLDPYELAEAFRETGESPVTLMMRMMFGSMNRGDDDPDEELKARIARGEVERPEPFDMVAALRSGNARFALRNQFAEVMLKMDSLGKALEGTVLLDGRNDKALEVLEREAEGGKKRMAIHYGAAHMRAFERSLIEEHGFEKVGEDWILAWKLGDAQAAESAEGGDAPERDGAAAGRKKGT